MTDLESFIDAFDRYIKAENTNGEWMEVMAAWGKIKPKPPVDTSLAASIMRFNMVPNGMKVQEYYDNESLVFEDRDRVIEAARKWDETFIKVDQ